MPTPSIYRMIGTKVQPNINIFWLMFIISSLMWISSIEFGFEFPSMWHVISMSGWIVSVNMTSIVIWYSEEDGKFGRKIRTMAPWLYNGFKKFLRVTAWPYAAWMAIMNIYYLFLLVILLSLIRIGWG